MLSTECAGLVLLALSGFSPPPPFRGTYAAVVAPLDQQAASLATTAGSGEVHKLWDPVSLWGNQVEDDACLVREGASGHYGRLALAELETVVSGEMATSPLAAVLSLQEVGFAAAYIGRSRGRQEQQQLVSQAPEQEDLLPGTCLALVALQLPMDLQQPKGAGLRNGTVTHTPPAKFEKLMAVEATLAEQRRKAETEGTAVFRGLELRVPSLQLRPRDSSGTLVDVAKAALHGANMPCRILDLGTGSGALLLALLAELGPTASGEAVDIDEEAVETCRENAVRVLGSERAASSVRVVHADFACLDQSKARAELSKSGYDLVICNPPYRSEAQQEAYDRSTGQFGGHAEHARTLVGGKTGFEMYEAIAKCLARDAAKASGTGAQDGVGPLLRSGALVIFQVEAGRGGHLGGVGAQVGECVERASEGWLVMHGVHKDEAGLERCILLREHLVA